MVNPNNGECWENRSTNDITYFRDQHLLNAIKLQIRKQDELLIDASDPFSQNTISDRLMELIKFHGLDEVSHLTLSMCLLDLPENLKNTYFELLFDEYKSRNLDTNKVFNYIDAIEKHGQFKEFEVII